jgi:uncharacterized protein YmfQ (DUF2313 family)
MADDPSQPPRDRHYRRDGSDYAASALQLLPYGQAWPRAPDSTLVLTIEGLFDLYGLVDGRAADLLEIESDPRPWANGGGTTDVVPSPRSTTPYGPWPGLLTDWERNWGLPDPCFPDAASEEDRRKMLILVMTLLGGQSRAFYEYISAWVGYDIEITELAPYMCGVSEVGDTRGEYDDTANFRWYLGSEEIRFYWAIRADEAVLKWFRTGAGGGECGVDHHLEIYLESPLECLLRRWKPAHTELVFDYESSLENAGEIVS